MMPRVLSLSCLVMAAACGGGSPTGSNPPSHVPASIQITPPVATVVPDTDMLVMHADVRDSSGTLMPGVKVNWASNDQTNIGIDSTGAVRSHPWSFERQVTIRATVPGTSLVDTAIVYTMRYAQRVVIVATVNGRPAVTVMTPNDSARFQARSYVAYVAANHLTGWDSLSAWQDQEWTSRNPAVADVRRDGMVVARSPGATYIVANGRGRPGVTDSARVVVQTPPNASKIAAGGLTRP